jgi:hypothetical protein
MFCWLDSFTQCHPPFIHQGMDSNPTSCTILTFYADLIKWADGLHHFLTFYADLIKWVDGRWANGLAQHS